MAEVLTPRKVPARASRPRGGFAWFAAEVGLWVAFFGLLVVSEQTLAAIWTAVRALPIVVEAAIWLLLFPWMLGLAVWEGSWDEWLRLALVASFAAGWSIAFFPWRRTGARRP